LVLQFNPLGTPATPQARCGDGVGHGSAQLRGAPVLQVQGQESSIIEPVDVTQLVIELQAVQHPGAIVKAEDVTGQQVTVAIDDAPGLLPSRQQRLPPVEEP
jgi:hypothetical protein